MTNPAYKVDLEFLSYTPKGFFKILFQFFTFFKALLVIQVNDTMIF